MKIKQISQASDIRRIWKPVIALALALCMGAFIGTGQVHASCIALDDVPLDVQEQQAPGIVMVVLDDSGSMDWEYIVQGTADALFRVGSTRYYYLFDNPGDNQYTGMRLEGSTHANRWMARWAGHNRLYYDPKDTYAPWPTLSNANPDNPRSHPYVAGNTLNLNATYYDYGDGDDDSGEITDDRIRQAGGVIVDDSDEGGTIDEIIIDHGDPGYEETGGGWNNSGAPASDEHNGQSRYTNSTGSYATWTPNIQGTGTYRVEVWYVYWSTRDTNALYTVHHADGTYTTRINQRDGNANGWFELGEFNFDQGNSGYIRVTRDDQSTGSSTSADAVRLVRVDGTPVKTFEGTYNGGDWTQLWYTGSAYAHPGDSNYTHDGWRWNTGDYTATWTANYLDMNQAYDVYVRSPTYYNYYSNSLEYQIMDNNAIIATSDPVNQRINDGVWVQIASNLTFSSGIGKVYLEHNATGDGSWVFADAVAFMPAVEFEPLNLIRAHYYTKVDDTVYLVNLDGGFRYYRVDDANNNQNIDNSSELIPLTAAQAGEAGIVTGRTYAEERQNFANWYSFYRKRELTAANAVAKVIDEMDGVYIGISGINRGFVSIARPVRVELNDVLYNQSADLLHALYSIAISAQGTPLRNGLHNIGRYFQGHNAGTHITSATPSGYFNSSTYPYFLAEYGGSCQQAFTILMTDGFWNGSHSTVGNADANTANPFDGPPFADTYSNTLADVAMYYYKNDLKTGLNNDVPINIIDKATHQHMVTYSLSFGQFGTLNPSDYPDCPIGDCPAWPGPSANADTTIDDLWHAAVNGRGKFVNASSPMEMVNAMNELKQDIQSRLGSSASLATSSIQRTVGTTIYQGTYNTANWSGEVTALSVNVDTGAVGSAKWKASEHVPNHADRNIISFDGSSTINFQYDTLTSAQQSLLGNNGHNVDHLVNYLRGDTSRNQANGGPFRVRNNPIGDIVHSAPTYHKGVVYIGANDGMLHAINADDGEEIFCYVPNMVYGHLSELALPGYSHKYYVDNTPTIGRVGSADILVCGLGKGGKGYFGLDVTSTSNPSALWEYTNDNDLGYSFSEVKIVTTDAGRMVVFGNGYDSVNQNAVLFLVDPITGNLVRKLDTQVGGCNGLATPTIVDVNGDGNADFVFAGDLKGNMWKFDIRGDAVDWDVYYGGTAPQPLISMRNADGDVQPITTAPEVMLDCAKSDFAATGKGLMVIFGTGRYLNSGDFSDNTTQSFYGIWDWGDIWETREDYAVAKTKYLGEVQSGRSLSNISGTSLQVQTVESSSGKWLTLSNNPLEWYNPIADTGEHMGWVFDLPVTGERGIREPMLRMGVAILTSIIPSSSPCDAGGSSVVYMVNACTGGRTYDPQFDVDGDGYIDEDDLIDGLPPTGQEFDEILYPPIEIGASDLYFSDASGGITPLQVPPNLMGMQFWRVIQ